MDNKYKFILIFSLVMLGGSVQAATLYVCPNGCMYSSIQAAIAAAKPGDTINVSAGIYKENLIIDKSLKINGSDWSKTSKWTIIDGNNKGSALLIGNNNPNADVTLSNIDILRGSGTLLPVASIGTIPCGGCILNFGKLTLNDVYLTNNRAVYGGGIYNAGVVTLTDCGISESIAGGSRFEYGRGGGIFNSGTLFLRRGGLEKNTADSGGGIYNDKQGKVDVAGCVLTKNTASNEGGAIENYGGLTVKNDCTIYDNAADSGGGISNEEDSMAAVWDSIITKNSGGIYFSSGGYDGGGGINSGGLLTVIRSVISLNSGCGIRAAGTTWIIGSTISQNSAEDFGGGILNFWGTMSISDCIISKNSAKEGGGIGSWGGTGPDSIYGTLKMTNSNISGNTAETGGGFYIMGGASSIYASNISRNIADYNGGGIYFSNSKPDLDDKTSITGNLPDQIYNYY